MKEFACGYVIPGCEARFRAADLQEMFALVAAHAREDHGITASPLPQDVVVRVREAIRTVPDRSVPDRSVPDHRAPEPGRHRVGRHRAREGAPADR